HSLRATDRFPLFPYTTLFRSVSPWKERVAMLGARSSDAGGGAADDPSGGGTEHRARGARLTPLRCPATMRAGEDGLQIGFAPKTTPRSRSRAAARSSRPKTVPRPLGTRTLRSRNATLTRRAREPPRPPHRCSGTPAPRRRAGARSSCPGQRRLRCVAQGMCPVASEGVMTRGRFFRVGRRGFDRRPGDLGGASPCALVRLRPVTYLTPSSRCHSEMSAPCNPPSLARRPICPSTYATVRKHAASTLPVPAATDPAAAKNHLRAASRKVPPTGP